MGKIIVADPRVFQDGYKWAASHPERVTRELKNYIALARSGPPTLRDWAAGIVTWWDGQLSAYHGVSDQLL